MNLLNKFDSVEIKNDTRLTEADKKFCEAQRGLYVKVLNHYREMFKTLQGVLKQDKEFYDSVKADNTEERGGYTYKTYSHEFFEIERRDMLSLFQETHTKFIEEINGYFRRKYNVTIADGAWDDYIKLEKPINPTNDYSWSYHRNMSDEEKAKHKERMAVYDAEVAAYEDAIIDYELHYNPIVDDIFVSLGGFSFTEKADREIKDAARSCVMPYYCKEPKFALKNGKISFDILYSSKCRYSGKYEMRLDGEGYRDLLRALSYFDSDEAISSTYSYWLREFSGYTKYESDGIYDTHETYRTKVTHFKFYKNGKFEVTFDNHTSALTFAKDYLGHVA